MSLFGIKSMATLGLVQIRRVVGTKVMFYVYQTPIVGPGFLPLALSL
jgi:hypothetical protein